MVQTLPQMGIIGKFVKKYIIDYSRLMLQRKQHKRELCPKLNMCNILIAEKLRKFDDVSH